MTQIKVDSVEGLNLPPLLARTADNFVGTVHTIGHGGFLKPNEAIDIGVLTPLITKLFDAVISCITGQVPGSANQQAARMKNPEPGDVENLERLAERRAKRDIRKPAKRNPTGKRLTRDERDELRDDTAERLVQSFNRTVDTSSAAELADAIRERRANA